MARARLVNEKPGQTLQATALVHEVRVKIARSDSPPFANRRHFFKVADVAMQQTRAKLLAPRVKPL